MMSRDSVQSQDAAFPPPPASLPDLPVLVFQENDVVVIAFSGEISLPASPLLRERLLALSADGGDAPVVVDLRYVPFMDSAGFSALVAGRKALADSGRRLSVRLRLGSQTCRTFDLMRLSAVIPSVRDGDLD